MEVYMKLRNETKGALRYDEVHLDGSLFSIGDGAPMGSMYMRKSAYPNGAYPKFLTVDIRDGDEIGTVAELPHG